MTLSLAKLASGDQNSAESQSYFAGSPHHCDLKMQGSRRQSRQRHFRAGLRFRDEGGAYLTGQSELRILFRTRRLVYTAVGGNAKKQKVLDAALQFR